MHSIRVLFAALLAFACITGPALAQKFSVQGIVLIYDTEASEDPDENEIQDDDIDRLLEVLRENPNVKTLQLNSEGGSVYASKEMAHIIIDFGLDTLASGSCFSSCVRLFLAGQKRQMTLGSKIGFHQTHWPAQAIRSYYENWSGDEGWDDPFEFASWVYEDTQAEVFEDLTYMIGRGVDAAFAVKTKGIRNDDEWYPSRLELIHAGVLRD